MHTGRKILNLRCDRKVSQQDLARSCSITPSALSKIEAGINSPRANIIWKIARNLGVTVEYLLDEEMPYPYPSYRYRQAFLSEDQDPATRVSMDVTREESAFLNALRTSNEIAREVAYAIPDVSVETIRLVHFLVNHSTVDNPSQRFLKHFESLLTTGDLVETHAAPQATPQSARKKSARKKSARRNGAPRSHRRKSPRKKVTVKAKAKRARRRA